MSGGQTVNPSTAELLAAVERANASQVVLLPGNKNIIPVAEQVDSLTTKTVRVVPARSMIEGLAADGLRPRGRRAGQRAADAPGRRSRGHRRGDARCARRRRLPALSPRVTGWASCGDGIVAIGGDVAAATKALLEHLVDDDRELITLITGSDAEEDVTAELSAWIGERFPRRTGGPPRRSTAVSVLGGRGVNEPAGPRSG